MCPLDGRTGFHFALLNPLGYLIEVSYSLGWEPGEGNGYPLQQSCLENAMDRGAWQSTQSLGGKESDTTERLSSSMSTSQKELSLFFYK